MKNWVSKSSGVESNGVPGMVGSTRSAAATVWLGLNGVSPQDIYVLSCEGGLRRQQGNNLIGSEAACVEESSQNGVDSV